MSAIDEAFDVAIKKFTKSGRENQYKQLKEDQNANPRYRQCYIALGPSFMTLSLGMVEGYSAILLPQLEKDGSMDISKEMASWIASISALPTPLGCILGGWLMELVGRKATHIVCCIPCLIGWILIYFSTSMTPLLLGRFLTGLCLGLMGPPTGVYTSEMSDPGFRPFLLAVLSCALIVGIALAHILGTFISWQNTALIACLFPVMCVVAMIPAPESPTFLAKKSKMPQAIQAFYWCRGYGEKANLELNELIQRQTALTRMPKKTIVQYLVDLKKPEFLKPLLIILVFFATSQWCGSNAMTFYNVDIIKETLGDSFDEYHSMIIMDIVRVVGSIIACYLMKRMRRRPLTMISCIGTLCCLFTLSAFSFFLKYNPSLKPYSILGLIALISYMAFITVGIMPLTWAMMGEVFPLANRGMGSGITSMANYLMIFIVVKITPSMFFNLGTDGSFLLFGVCCLVGTVTLALFLPETKNKPLHEIEDYFKGIVQ